ncbi:hypothetical protein [Glycomyces sp. YM15]|uniref:hypothetical protein n=1 Tax=Glycomyces sp. YM15 TaxID=2800446 RepID=UPI0019643570|nr:hypothetical protein [Glycomyces sp. YM15]
MNAEAQAAGPAPAEAASSPTGSPLVAAGIVSVLLGGLVAAVTGPLDLAKGSWLAAYLVLVCGAGSYAIGAAQTRSTARPLPPKVATQATGWAMGNTAVIAGSLAGVPAVVDVGGALLAVALVIALTHARDLQRRFLRSTYRLALVALLVSIPIGLVLAHLRA